MNKYNFCGQSTAFFPPTFYYLTPRAGNLYRLFVLFSKIFFSSSAVRPRFYCDMIDPIVGHLRMFILSFSYDKRRRKGCTPRSNDIYT